MKPTHRFFSRSTLTQAASALGLVALLLAAAGSKPNPDASASASADGGTTTTSAEVEEQKVSVSGAKVPNFEYIRAACENVAKRAQCDEYYGLAPQTMTDLCKTEGGKWVGGWPMPSNACPKEKLIGTCHVIQSAPGQPGVFANYYANGTQSVAELKKDCLDYPVKSKKTEWIDPPAPAAAAPAPTTPKGAAKGAKPQAAPTANADKTKAKGK